MKGKLKGYLTVEASMLMLLLIPALTALLLAGFFVHDRAYLQGVAAEASAMGSNLQQYDNAASRLKKVGDLRLPKRLLWTRDVQVKTTYGRTAAGATLTGTFRIPGLIGHLLEEKYSSVTGSWKRKIYHPAALIRKMRGIKYVLSAAQGDTGS